MIPCSIVGHLFRRAFPYSVSTNCLVWVKFSFKYKQKQADDLSEIFGTNPLDPLMTKSDFKSMKGSERFSGLLPKFFPVFFWILLVFSKYHIFCQRDLISTCLPSLPQNCYELNLQLEQFKELLCLFRKGPKSRWPAEQVISSYFLAPCYLDSIKKDLCEVGTIYRQH